MFTAREVCQFFKISKSTLYNLVRRGDFPPGKKIGYRAVRWSQNDIESYIERNQKNGISYGNMILNQEISLTEIPF